MPFPQTHPSLARALADRGYAEPTSVQAAVLQEEAVGRDLLVSAQTGSGKTVAYGLALASTLLGDEERLAPAGAPLALVVAPTRELALQVQRELVWLYGPAGARIASGVGGMDIRREARALSDGAHILVGTPGRLRDHLERGRVDASSLRAVVLDEADEMLDLGFREDLEFILDATPAERRTLLFSATLPREIVTLARRFQRDAFRIDTVDQSQPHADIEYRAVRIAPNEIEHAAVNVLRFFEARGAMIFCHTREAVRHLHASLLERGFSAVALSGELTQGERNHALQSLRDGRARVCVATDVAARGIDLPDLGLVIHADLPNDRDTLLHRSGRTGRAGRKGTCVLLVPYTRRRKAEGLLAQARIEALWGPPPTADQVRAADQQRLVQDLAFTEEPAEEDLAMARALLAERSPEEIASALVRFHRARLPAPEELFDGGEPERGGRKERRERKEREDEGGEASPGMVWFRMNVGRRNNADPRWLVPIICRLGHVTKREIGVIKIGDRETRFEIVEAIAPRFAAAARRAPNDEDIQIDLADAVLPPSGARGPKSQGFKPRGGKPGGGNPGGGKPGAGKPGGHEGGPAKPKWGKRPPGKAHPADGAPKAHRGKPHPGGPKPRKARGSHGSA
ncbi:MAG TPA: DEAD/DEAH box helicase [Microvirga sp.]|jgi:ATP-dependent RNA helicase DeaD|nr:DEAD/DEAH box helicase [Microvirga sp.]